jgi:predicted amidophosphoribosyltransferase
MKYLHVQLKVCEGCGALWLRIEETNAVYCRNCTARLAAFPDVRAKHPGGRPRLARAVGCSAARRRSGGAQ